MSVDLRSVTATITSGQSLSASAEVNGEHVIGIIVPASWTAAGLSFQGSFDGTNFFELYDMSGVALSVPVVVSSYTVIQPTAMHGVNFVKVRSGTSGSPVTQSSTMVLTLLTRRYR